MNVSDWLSQWITLRSCALAPRTIESYESLNKNHITPAIGSVPLETLTAMQVQSLLASLCAAGHSRTAQLCYILLKASIRDAVQCGHLTASPLNRVLPPRHQKSDPRWWSAEELRRFIDATATRPYGIAWLLALTCGLRRGELAGLRWSDIDFDAQVIHIRQQRQRLAAEGLVDLPLKSRSSRRSLPIPHGMGPLLLARRREAAALSLRLGRPVIYVLSTSAGEGIDPHTLNKALSHDIALSGIRPINLHGLRHTMASLSVSLGVPIKVVQSILGHASYQLTADTYAHVLPDDMRKAAVKLSTACFST